MSDRPRYESNVTDPIIEVRDATVTFEMERGESRVLDGLDLDIGREETLGVVGESGSGKSMFASSLLNAVVEPGQFSGEITYRPREGDPVDIHDLDDQELKAIRWEEISFVIQGAQSGFNPTMKVRGHFWDTLNEHDYDIEEGMERGRQLLRDLYLDPEQVMDSYAHELSGGMKQRALIALGLVLEPNVLVMDEPTAALDLLMQRSIISLLHDLKEERDLSLVFVTHDLPLVSDLADRLAVMYAFDVVEIGEVNDILNRSVHPYTRALLNSVPHIDAPVEEMTAIPGSSPDPVETPRGCSYHPRCPLADDQCRETDPPLYDTHDTGHTSACHYWEEVPEAIDLHTEEGQATTWDENDDGRTGTVTGGQER